MAKKLQEITTNGDNSKEASKDIEASDGQVSQSGVVNGETETSYFSSLYPGLSETVEPGFAQTIKAIERILGIPVWLIIHRDGSYYLDDQTSDLFFSARNELVKSDKIALIIDSPGGFANSAYRIATLLQRVCGGYIAIVPRYAKSAATLLAFGAETIYMGEHAELGPLDVQLVDPEREDVMSALDEVESLERLTAYALKAVDETMALLSSRTGKKISSLLPLSLEFVSGLLKPMLQGVDIVHYTQQSRILKVAEAYAYRLLATNYGRKIASEIAEHFVSHYPEHGFIINLEEMRGMGYIQMGLVTEIEGELVEHIDKLFDYLNTESCTYIGQLIEVNHEKQSQ